MVKGVRNAIDRSLNLFREFAPLFAGMAAIYFSLEWLLPNESKELRGALFVLGWACLYLHWKVRRVVDRLGVDWQYLDWAAGSEVAPISPKHDWPKLDRLHFEFSGRDQAFCRHFSKLPVLLNEELSEAETLWRVQVNKDLHYGLGEIDLTGVNCSIFYGANPVGHLILADGGGGFFPDKYDLEHSVVKVGVEINDARSFQPYQLNELFDSLLFLVASDDEERRMAKYEITAAMVASSWAIRPTVAGKALLDFTFSGSATRYKQMLKRSQGQRKQSAGH